MAGKLSQNPLSIPMSQIIAADAPLLSPLSQSWDNLSPTNDAFTYAYYNLPSPPLSDIHSPHLKMRMLPDSALDQQPVCMPTHQVFDFPEVQRPLTPPSRSPSVSAQAVINAAAAVFDPSSAVLFGGMAAVDATLDHPSEESESTSCGSKRSASPAPPVAKKRAVGERVASKDFIPPDVTGLSKREARLVKNRAAAFLSRQRKREEFETMEIRVAELEQENKRLLALSQNGSTASDSAAVNPVSSSSSQSEVELLKAQLAAAQERERSLSAQLASQQKAVVVPTAPAAAPTNAGPSIKLESIDSEPQFSSLASSLLSSPARSTVAVPSAHKSSASLGLMVLLCALPSLLSMRMQAPASSSSNFAITNPFRASSNHPSSNYFMPNDYEWSKPDDGSSGSLMDLDNDNASSQGARPSGTRKLEFTGLDGVDDLGLGDLDISFDTAPSDDGKIRVRIHGGSGSASSSRQVSRSSSRQVSRGATPVVEEESVSGTQRPRVSSLGMDSLSMTGGGASPFTTSSSDPFLGVTSGDDTDMDFGLGLGLGSLGSLGSLDGPFSSDGYYGVSGAGAKFGDLALASPLSEGSSFFSECATGTAEGGKRRVRIALKSMPQEGGEGGEWEVQLC